MSCVMDFRPKSTIAYQGGAKTLDSMRKPCGILSRPYPSSFLPLLLPSCPLFLHSSTILYVSFNPFFMNHPFPCSPPSVCVSFSHFLVQVRSFPGRSPAKIRPGKPISDPKAPLRTIEYVFIRFGAMDVTKPSEFIRFGAMDVSKPYKFIGFGSTIA